MNVSGAPDDVHDQLTALLPRLRRFARTLTRNPHDADDVVQVALERALANLAQWRRDARLDSWMFRIVRNAWIDELRARQRRDRAVDDAHDLAGGDGVWGLGELIAAALALLALQQAVILELEQNQFEKLARHVVGRRNLRN